MSNKVVVSVNEDQEYVLKDGTNLELYMEECEFIYACHFIRSRDLPLLKDNITGRFYMPRPSLNYINKKIIEDQASIYDTLLVSLPQGLNERKYSFCQDIPLKYSAIDYIFIPGLYRWNNDGFLTPVFFNIDVLNKYSQSPKYDFKVLSGTYGSISKGDEFSIQFGINKKKKVIMWLGDISGLPKSEQLYLASENVESDHDIHSEFYNGQIGVQWAKPSVESSAYSLRNQIDNAMKEIYGVPFYMLEGEISETFSNLEKPIFWEDKHVFPVIEAINRIFVESINVSEIKKSAIPSEKVKDYKEMKGLKLISKWLSEELVIDGVDDIMCPFFVLYDFRLISTHLHTNDKKKEKIDFIKERLKIDKNTTGYEEIYDALFREIQISLDKILSGLNLHSRKMQPGNSC